MKDGCGGSNLKMSLVSQVDFFFSSVLNVSKIIMISAIISITKRQVLPCNTFFFFHSVFIIQQRTKGCLLVRLFY